MILISVKNTLVFFISHYRGVVFLNEGLHAKTINQFTFLIFFEMLKWDIQLLFFGFRKISASFPGFKADMFVEFTSMCLKSSLVRAVGKTFSVQSFESYRVMWNDLNAPKSPQTQKKFLFLSLTLIPMPHTDNSHYEVRPPEEEHVEEC